MLPWVLRTSLSCARLATTLIFIGFALRCRAQTGVAEWAYGALPWFEAGVYFPLYSITRDNSILYDGFKLRALFVAPDAAKREFFYGVNFEFSFNTAHWDQRTYTSEIRPIIGTHWGRFDFIFNPIVDNSWTGFSNLEFVPATRAAMAITDRLKVAIEEYDDVHGLAIEAGIGAGLTSASDHRVVKLILSKDF